MFLSALLLLADLLDLCPILSRSTAGGVAEGLVEDGYRVVAEVVRKLLERHVVVRLGDDPRGLADTERIDIVVIGSARDIVDGLGDIGSVGTEHFSYLVKGQVLLGIYLLVAYKFLKSLEEHP